MKLFKKKNIFLRFYLKLTKKRRIYHREQEKFKQMLDKYWE